MLHTISFHASLLGENLTDKIKATHSHVLIYGAIEVHDMGEKGCFAGNQLLAEETGLTPATVQKCLSHMVSGGWIEMEYEGQKHSHRAKIIPLLKLVSPKSYSRVQPVVPQSNTSRTPEYNQSYPTVKHSILDNIEITDEITYISEESEKPKKAKPKKPTRKGFEAISPATQIADVIKACEMLDPKNKLFYGNPFQRQACDFLIQEYGFDEVIAMVGAIVAARGKVQYLPSVTTPAELKDKWQKVLNVANLSKFKPATRFVNL